MKRKLRKADRKKLSHALSAALGCDLVVERAVIAADVTVAPDAIRYTGRDKLILTVRTK